jgi:membrane-associated phospholipid phosphatase
MRWMNREWMKARAAIGLLAFSAVGVITARAARADVVTDWNENTQAAIKTAVTAPAATSRVFAIVHAAVFDAVNGISRRYLPYHVDFEAPKDASRRAAAIQAAYGALVKLFPAQKATLDARRAASLAAIAEAAEDDDSEEDDGEDAEHVARGVAWGQAVADDILAWRSADGFSAAFPPYVGGTAPGQWRPTPPDFRTAVFQQIATMVPFAMPSPSWARPAGPPAMTSLQYAFDFNEVKAIGSRVSSTRTAEQTTIAFFWDDNGGVQWNRIALAVAAQHRNTLSENARLLALMNIAMADAGIAAWDGKYFYSSWRPVTAIPLGDTDGNPLTQADPGWLPLRPLTPPHQEYPSAHSTNTGAAAVVLAAFFGDDTPFSATSDATPGLVRSWSRFSDAALEVNNARVYFGIHFRSAVVDGRAAGEAVAQYVLAHVAQRAHPRRSGQTKHDHGHGEITPDGQITGGEDSE